jgi:hypothetical protein
MEWAVKVAVCLVDGMVWGQQEVALRRVIGWMVAVGAGRWAGGVGRRVGWDDAPGRCGSAGRHTAIRGLGPHVGDAQEGALTSFASAGPRQRTPGDRSCSGGVAARGGRVSSSADRKR